MSKNLPAQRFSSRSSLRTILWLQRQARIKSSEVLQPSTCSTALSSIRHAHVLALCESITYPKLRATLRQAKSASEARNLLHSLSANLKGQGSRSNKSQSKFIVRTTSMCPLEIPSCPKKLPKQLTSTVLFSPARRNLTT